MKSMKLIAAAFALALAAGNALADLSVPILNAYRLSFEGSKFCEMETGTFFDADGNSALTLFVGGDDPIDVGKDMAFNNHKLIDANLTGCTVGIGATDWLYFGPTNTVGSFRMGVSGGGNLSVESYDGSSWEMSAEFNPSE